MVAAAIGSAVRPTWARHVALAAALSTAGAITTAPTGAARAHEVDPAVMDAAVGEALRLEVTLNAEAILAGVDLAAHADTDDAPEAEAEAYDALRALPPERLAARFEAGFAEWARTLTLEGAGAPALVSAAATPEPDEALARDTRVVLEAPMEAPAVRIGWAESNGPLILRHQGAEDGFAALLAPGEVSPPLVRADGAEGADGADGGPPTTLARHAAAGFEHVVARGLDHVLFVLGLLLHAPAWGPLLWLMAAFTLGHAATLALATLGVVSVPAAVVGPLIALSVVFVGVAGALRLRGHEPRIGPARLAVVLGFGLAHGLAFAAALAEADGGGGLAWRLIGFGLGAQAALLAAIAAAWALPALPLGGRAFRRPGVAVPASLAIAVVGAFWAAERTLLA